MTNKICNFETLYNEFAYGDISKIEVYFVDYGRYQNWQLWGSSSDGETMRDFGTFHSYQSQYAFLVAGVYVK